MPVPLAAWLAPLLVLLAPGNPDPGLREWNQEHASSDGCSMNDVAPVESAPGEAWRVKPGEILGEPVGWGGSVYVVARVQGERRLYAYDLASGKSMAPYAKLTPGGNVHVAVWEGFVAVCDATGIQILSHKGSSFASQRRQIPGAFAAAPAIHAGWLFALDTGGVLQLVDLHAGKLAGSFDLHGVGQPCVVANENKGEALVVAVGYGERPHPDPAKRYLGTWLALRRATVKGLDGATPTCGSPAVDWRGVFKNENVDRKDLDSAFVARLPGTAGKSGDWFSFTGAEIVADDHKGYNATLGEHLAPIATQPALLANGAVGFAADGALIRFRPDGSFVKVVAERQPLPEGARHGRATQARGVLYLENWAVESNSGRILWCDPKLQPATPLLPMADQRLVYLSGDGELVCLAVRSNTSASTPVAASDARTITINRPGHGDGLVLESGRRIEGTLHASAEHAWSVQQKDATPQSYPESDIALIENGADVRLVGAENAVYLAAKSALRTEALELLLSLFELYRKDGFSDDCQRLLDGAREQGLDEPHRLELARKLSGRAALDTDSARTARKLANQEEQQRRAKLAQSFDDQARWLAAHACVRSATALAARSVALRPESSKADPLVRPWIPAGFPDANGADAPARWMKLASAILPVDGNIVASDDPLWKTLAAPWNTDAFAVRTRSLVLVSRERDPEIVGAAVRHGENALHALATLLDVSPPTDAARMQVRLHRSREEYLAEQPDKGKSIEWTAGYYSPYEHVSRFYVPREKASTSLLEGDLYHVLVHELTHQFVAERWLGQTREQVDANFERPGFWLVEGFARFVEDQGVEMDRRGLRFDDDTVESIDASARLAAKGMLFPVEKLLALTQHEFSKLPTKDAGTVTLKNTLQERSVAPRSIFYEQAGSLVYFLVNDPDATHRTKLLDFMRRWYAGKATEHGADQLGFSAATELEQAYAGFLKTR